MAEEKPAEAAAAPAAEEPKVVTTPRGGGAAFEIPLEKHADAESDVRKRLEGAPPSPRKSKEQLDQGYQEAEARHLAQLEEVRAKAANEVEKAEKRKEEHQAREKATEGVAEPEVTVQKERAVAFELDAGKRPGSASPTKHRLEGAPPSPRKTKEQLDRDLEEAEKRRQAELATVKAKAADEVERAHAVASEVPKSPRKAEVPPAMASAPQTEETPIVPKEPKPLDQLIAEDDARHKKEPPPAAAKKPAAAAKPKPPPSKKAVKPAPVTKSPARSPARPAAAGVAAKTPTKAKPAVAAATPTKKATPTKAAAPAPSAAAKKSPPKAVEKKAPPKK